MAMVVVLVIYHCTITVNCSTNILQAQYAVLADNTFAQQGGTTNINYLKMFDQKMLLPWSSCRLTAPLDSYIPLHSTHALWHL